MQLPSQNTEIFLKEQGSGSPILFLHGNPDSADLWDPIVAQLQPRWHCFAPDLPGFGRSGIPQNFESSLEYFSDFIDQLVTGIGINEPLNLVVHDLGAVFGLAWAVRHPQKLRRLAIMNTAFSSSYRWHTWARIWRTPVLGELAMATSNWWIFSWEMQRASNHLSTEYLRHTYSLISPSMLQMVLRLYRALDPKIFRGWEDEVRQLASSIPTCVLWGDQDSYIPSRYAHEFGAQQVYHFPDCGHWLPAEAPEAVAGKLAEFLV